MTIEAGLCFVERCACNMSLNVLMLYTLLRSFPFIVSDLIALYSPCEESLGKLILHLMYDDEHCRVGVYAFNSCSQQNSLISWFLREGLG